MTPGPPPDRPESPALPLTGERTVPGVPEETYWFARHVAAYRWVAALAVEEGATHVVDAGCGEGYGIGLLADSTDPHRTRRITGVELDPAVAEHARRRYGADDRVALLEAELGAIPLERGTADLVALLQVIEHLHDVDGALAELVRLTRPGGALVVTTPNRRTFSPGDAAPANPFHVREFAPDELAVTLAAAGLALERWLGLHHAERLADVERERGTTLHAELTRGPADAWPDWLAELVVTVTPDDFELRPGLPGQPELEEALDLFVIARVPRTPDVRG